LVKALGAIKTTGFKIDLVETKDKLTGFKVIHYPYFDLFFPSLPLVKKAKTIVTVHDVIPLRFPRQYPPGLKGELNFKKQKFSLKKAQAVITDSNQSKIDIINYLGYPKNKIRVIYLACSDDYRPIQSTMILNSIIAKYRLPKRFVLYVGDVNYHKNVLRLVKACQQLKIPLVIVGKKAIERDFDQSHIENQPLVQLNKLCKKDSQIIRLGFIPTQDLVAIFNLAAAYCQPSLYEGFGLPVLQAMACGTPVVAAKAGSLPEVCGQAALMVDPRKQEKIVQGLKVILSDSEIRGKLIKVGFEQVKKFSWKKTARETLVVYGQVAKQ
jgi:glycosyltransferase involved in cell wall biosynthesis